MAKARSSGKSGGKARKAGKVKQSKAGSGKARRPKVASGATAKARKPVSAPKLRKPAPVEEIPEIPPPLPAPIASFTF
jgi:hypothetical protein